MDWTWDKLKGYGHPRIHMRRYANIAASVEKHQDCGNLSGLSRTEPEKRLLELIDAGQTIDAAYSVRKFHSYDLPQERDFIEYLRSGRISK